MDLKLFSHSAFLNLECAMLNYFPLNVHASECTDMIG